MTNYKGYKNKVTFDFISNIMNDQDDYTTAMDMVKDAKDYNGSYSLRSKIKAQLALSDMLRNWADDMADDALSSYQYTHPFIKSVVNSAIAEIDFYEVAETLIADSKDLKEV